MRNVLTLALLAPVFVATGCGPNIGFRDHDPDVPHFLGKRSDNLAGTYAEGSALTFWIRAGRDLSSYEVRSNDTDVFEILTVSTDDRDDLVVSGTALSAGSFELEVVKPNGRVLEAVALDVARPDRFRLLNLALLRAGATPDAAALTDFKTLEQSQVALAVETSANGVALAGNAGITVEDAADDDFGIETETRQGADHPTWVQIDSRLEDGVVPVLWKDEVVLEARVDVVPATAIASLTLMGSEDGAGNGDTVNLHASAADAQGEAILGAQATWSLEPSDGASSSGDLYVYTVDDSQDNELTASFGEFQATTRISGTGSAIESSDIGCSTVNYPGVLSMVLGLVGLARRRR